MAYPRHRIWLQRRRDRPGQSRAISTNFQLLPIKERAVSAQKLEMAVRFSTPGTGAATCSHCAQRGLKQPRLHLTRHHERSASVHPTPFAPTSIEAGASRRRLGIPKPPDRIFAPHTVAKYMRGCRRRPPTGTWLEFLTRHASNMWACDFFCVPTVLFQTLHVFFVIRLANKEILHVAVTRHPTADWAAQQIVECCAWDRAPPRFLDSRSRQPL
jgi:hypothetical protein